MGVGLSYYCERLSISCTMMVVLSQRYAQVILGCPL